MHAWNSARGLLHTVRRRLYAAGKHILVPGLLHAHDDLPYFQRVLHFALSSALTMSYVALRCSTTVHIARSDQFENVYIVCESLAKERDTHKPRGRSEEAIKKLCYRTR
jgi:hypothetical protein